ncbi:MAG TPA: hypothetical protein PK201_07200 [Accumulibacter sp.]|nr:hypothetical protein [Accumulibacter sp.]
MQQGVLQLALTWDGQQIATAEVASTRPAAGGLRGLPVARALEIIRRLFSICLCAQAAAARPALPAARGTLRHRVELDGDRLARHVTVAPTDWNFHPQVAFVRELGGGPARTRAEAGMAARCLALALDPCVPSELVVKDA